MAFFDFLLIFRPLLSYVEEWDSLSFVIFIAMAKTTYDRKVDRHAVAQAKSIRDLFDLLR